MSRKLSKPDRFYTGVIVACAVIYLVIGCYMLLGFIAWRLSLDQRRRIPQFPYTERFDYPELIFPSLVGACL